MRTGFTLSRHVGWQLARTVLVMFVLFVVLVTVFDFTQRARFVGEGLDLQTAAFMAILRGPGLAEEVLPFAMLFGAMVTFVQLNRRLELTVTRAAGVSAWQVLLPASLVAALLGMLAVMVYNPLATALREKSVEISGIETASAGFLDGGSVWLRQGGPDGPSVMGATQTAEEGTLLAGVTAFQYDANGRFVRRIDAPTARLVGSEWRLENAVVTEVGETPAPAESVTLATNLTLTQIRDSLVDPDTVAIWRLPALIEIAAATSLPADSLRLRFHTLVSLPVLLVAMVLIAAVVSLKFSRTLNLGRLIVTGAASGFVLYVVLVVSRDLGRGGVLLPSVAAWAPALIAVLASVSVLLREEDG